MYCYYRLNLDEVRPELDEFRVKLVTDLYVLSKYSLEVTCV